MSYIWNDYSDNKRYVLSDTKNNTRAEIVGKEKDTFQINVLVRLYDAFFPQDYINSEKVLTELIAKYTNDPEYIDIFNFMVHVHVMFDRISGITVQDIIALCVDKQIQECAFGEEIKKKYLSCDDKIQFHLLNYYAQMILSNGTAELFESFIETVFKLVNVYVEIKTNMSIIYIHKEKNDINLAIVDLALFFLCRMNRNVIVLWKGEHMPIIGEDYSMVIDDMCLSF